uniref:PUM-HD domain-containing protein n=1 Tax=Steinernema glaseri TaxID=37863 RepID=A0A1I7Z206_9BILA
MNPPTPPPQRASSVEFVLVSPTGCILQNVSAVYGNHPPQRPLPFYAEGPSANQCTIMVNTPVMGTTGPRNMGHNMGNMGYGNGNGNETPVPVLTTPKNKLNTPRHARAVGLPAHVVLDGRIDYPLESIIDDQLIMRFALDRNGCQYLQDGYVAAPHRLHRRLFNELMKNFEMLSCDVFANFLMQTVVSLANDHEKNVIVRVMKGRMLRMCYNRYACRVVQKIIETASPDIAVELMSETAGQEARLAVDQNANHVFQKFLHTLEPHYFAPMISSISRNPDELLGVMKNKYGCRVVQLAFERLSAALEMYSGKSNAIHALVGKSANQLIVPLLREGRELVTNEYSNYVVQYVITADSFQNYREQIIQEHVIGRVLELSLQKFSSHVVEKSFRHAPTHLLYALFNEVFADFSFDRADNVIDVMMFDQFGNYVVQVMLDVVSQVRTGERQGSPRWLPMLAAAITRNEGGLIVYSSGKRLLDLTVATGMGAAHYERPQPVPLGQTEEKREMSPSSYGSEQEVETDETETRHNRSQVYNSVALRHA